MRAGMLGCLLVAVAGCGQKGADGSGRGNEGNGAGTAGPSAGQLAGEWWEVGEQPEAMYCELRPAGGASVGYLDRESGRVLVSNRGAWRVLTGGELEIRISEGQAYRARLDGGALVLTDDMGKHVRLVRRGGAKAGGR